MSGETGDFKGKQFSEEEVAAKVKEQYGEEHARIFYKVSPPCSSQNPENFHDVMKTSWEMRPITSILLHRGLCLGEEAGAVCQTVWRVGVETRRILLLVVVSVFHFRPPCAHEWAFLSARSPPWSLTRFACSAVRDGRRGARHPLRDLPLPEGRRLRILEGYQQEAPRGSGLDVPGETLRTVRIDSLHLDSQFCC